MKANWFLGFPIASNVPLCSWLSQLPQGLRIYPVEDLHVTFCFLGAHSCDLPSALQPLWAALKHGPPRAFQLQIDHALALPSASRCSALALGFAPDAETARLKAYMLAWREQLLEAVASNARHEQSANRADSRHLNAPLEPLPHLTLGRPPSGITAETRAQIALHHLQYPIIPQELSLDRLALYTWSDNRAIQKFKIIQHFHLN